MQKGFFFLGSRRKRGGGTEVEKKNITHEDNARYSNLGAFARRDASLIGIPPLCVAKALMASCAAPVSTKKKKKKKKLGPTTSRVAIYPHLMVVCLLHAVVP
jgi:hypothetical protein